jgi:Flp pilus assembly pilin Flp
MHFMRAVYIRMRKLPRGQTMTEYALILTAVAVVAYAGYQALGTQVNTTVSSVNTLL